MEEVLSKLQQQQSRPVTTSDLPGHCLGFIPACNYNKPGGTLDKKGVGLEGPLDSKDLTSPPGSTKFYDLQGETTL